MTQPFGPPPVPPPQHRTSQVAPIATLAAVVGLLVGGIGGYVLATATRPDAPAVVAAAAQPLESTATAAARPVASFEYDLDINDTYPTYCPTTSVAFTDTSTGNPAAWQWTFSDGQTSTERNPVWYPLEGDPIVLDVQLTVTNAAGSTSASEEIAFPTC